MSLTSSITATEAQYLCGMIVKHCIFITAQSWCGEVSILIPGTQSLHSEVHKHLPLYRYQMNYSSKEHNSDTINLKCWEKSLHAALNWSCCHVPYIFTHHCTKNNSLSTVENRVPNYNCILSSVNAGTSSGYLNSKGGTAEHLFWTT